MKFRNSFIGKIEKNAETESYEELKQIAFGSTG